MKKEQMGRPIFYGAMITEGIVALIWATVAMYFFYDQPTPGYEQITDGEKALGDAPSIVNKICNEWLGVFGAILALLGVVAAPITSGDTAFRSARLIIADFIHLKQHSIRNRLMVCIPMFMGAIALLVWQMANPKGFDVIWSWFGWSNQTLAVFMLWAITVYLVQQRKPYVITLVPAIFMTVVCTTFLVTEQLLPIVMNNGTDEAKAAIAQFQQQWTWIIAACAFAVSVAWFLIWYLKKGKRQIMK